MTQATPYTRSTGFADDERNNVGGRSTVRTAQVDAELDAIAAPLYLTIANLSKLQRDDGVMRDGVVPVSALGADTLKLLTSASAIPRGAWTTATTYALRDLVTQSGNTYICAVAHTSGVFATDLAAVKWLLFQIGANPSATAIPFSPTVNVTSANVQAAILEVDANWRAGDVAASNKLAARTLVTDGAGGIGFNSALVYATGTIARWLTDLVTSVGASLVGFIQAATGANARTLQDKGSEIVSVMDFMTTAQKADARAGTITLDLTAAIQAAFTYAISLAPSMTDGGSVIEPLYTSSAYVGVRFPPGKYLISQAGGVTIPANAGLANLKIFGDPGATIVGNGTTSVDGTNTLFNFNGGAHKNVFKDLLFAHYGTAILVNTSNVNECMVQVDSCESKAGATFMDTVSYAASRSTMIHFKDSLFGDTAVVIKHYTDHLTIDNCWLYAKKSSLVAPLFLSGDGIVSINSSFFIPHGVQVSPVANSRWIDMICDSANSGGSDRSVKSLNIRGCRFSLESARPPIWFSDNNAALPSGANQVCSITIEDTYLGGAGGNPIVTYIKGYPGSVNFRNAKPLASAQIVSANATGTYGGVANTTYPVPSIPGTLTSHVIMIDEATRLALANSNNAASYVDPLLEPFCYDTTSQTSKYKRSIQKNIDYRLASVSAPGAGSGFVKATIPVFFDTTSAAPNRDILTFMLVTVSDADGPANSQPHERAQCTCLITVVGGNGGTAFKRIIKTVLQDAQGGTSFAVSAVPTVFWGQGDTGSADVAAGTTMGAATNITFAWFGRAPASAWAYIVPLAGLRENQQPLMQNGVW